MGFETWLEAQGLSPSTVKKYSGAISGPLSKWAREDQLNPKPIQEMIEINEFAELSELIEASDIFALRNQRGKHMYSSALRKYGKYLTDYSLAETPHHNQLGPFVNQLATIEVEKLADEPYVPDNKNDARKRVLREVVRRQGQPKFRESLMTAYERRCAVTKCSTIATLEAAHITPYRGVHTNATSNGLLLRADIHTLWDLALIAVDPMTMLVKTSPLLRDDEYKKLNGASVFQPNKMSERASKPALEEQWAAFQKNFRV